MIDVTQRPYRAAGDGVTDDWEAIQQAIDDGHPGIYLPRGRYRISRTLEIRKKVFMMGELGGGAYELPSILVADAGVTAMKICMPGGHGSRVSFMTIASAGKAGVAHGIVTKAIFQIETVAVLGFSGNGIHCHADSNDGEASNINCSLLYRPLVRDCDGIGIAFEGGDANACLTMGALVQNCKEGGIYDNSFLGNRFVGFTLEACAGFGFKNGRGGACFTTIMGGYVESDCGPNDFTLPGQWIGDEIGNTFTATSTGLVMSYGVQRMLFRDTVVGRAWQGHAIENNGQMWTVRSDRDLAPYGWSYSADLPGFPDGWHVYAYNHNRQYTPLAVGSQHSCEGMGQLWLPRGMHLGGDGGEIEKARYHTTGKAAPAADHYRKVWRSGDTVWNTRPAGQGQPMGWKCSVSGGWPNHRLTWTPNTGVECGDIIEPDPPNGFVYRVEDVGTSGLGATGDVQPTWTTGYGDRFTDGLGTSQIVWVCRGQKGPVFVPGPVW
jgi:hypothetical protein